MYKNIWKSKKKKIDWSDQLSTSTSKEFSINKKNISNSILLYIKIFRISFPLLFLPKNSSTISLQFSISKKKKRNIQPTNNITLKLVVSDVKKKTHLDSIDPK